MINMVNNSVDNLLAAHFSSQVTLFVLPLFAKECDWSARGKAGGDHLTAGLILSTGWRKVLSEVSALSLYYSIVWSGLEWSV